MDPLVLFFFSVVLLLLLELTAASPNPFPNPRFGLQENRLFPPQKPYARPAHRQQATRAPRDQHSNLALLDIVVSIQTSDCAQTANQAFATSYHTRSALEEEEDEESSRRRCHRCTGTFISEHLIVTSGQCLLFLQSGRDIKSLVLFTASSALHYRRLVELEILDLEFAATSGSQQGDGLDIGFIFVRGWLPPSLQTNMSRVSFSNNQQTEDGRLHQLFHGNLNVAGWFRLQQEAQDRCETRLIKVETFPQLSCLQAVGQRFANQGWLCAGKYLDTQAYNLNEGTPLVSFALSRHLVILHGFSTGLVPRGAFVATGTLMLMLLKSIKEKSFDTEDGGYQLTFQWSDLSEGHRRFFSLKTVLSRVGPTTPPPSPALVFGASQQQSPLPTESSPPPPLSPLTTHLSSTLQDEVGRIINFIRPLYRFVTLAESPTPWLVFIDRTGSEEYSCCNGVLIGQNKVLTSASCVEFGALIDEEKKDSLPGTLEVYSSHPENAVDDNINIRFKVLQIVNYPDKSHIDLAVLTVVQIENPANLPIVPIRIPGINSLAMITNTRYFKTFGWRQDSTLSLGGNSYEFAFSSVIENADYEVSPAHDDEGHSSNRYGLELIDRKVFTMSKQPTLFRLYPGAPIVTRAGSDGQWNLHGIGTDHFESVHAVYTTLTSPIIHWIEQQLIVA